MNPSNQLTDEHHDIWTLLPWFVNGRLSEFDRQRAEAHLRHCGACRDECAAQRQIYQVMGAEAGVEQLPMAGLNRLLQRIESTAMTNAAPAAETGAGVVRSVERLWTPRRARIAASLVAVTVSLGMLGVVLWNQAARHGESASYYTVTTTTPQPENAAIRAVFAPQVTLSELQAMLVDAQLKIVSGPTEAGVYSLALTGSRSADWSLQRLRGHDAVRFAEAIGSSSVAVPVR